MWVSNKKKWLLPDDNDVVPTFRRVTIASLVWYTLACFSNMKRIKRDRGSYITEARSVMKPRTATKNVSLFLGFFVLTNASNNTHTLCYGGVCCTNTSCIKIRYGRVVVNARGIQFTQNRTEQLNQVSIVRREASQFRSSTLLSVIIRTRKNCESLNI